MASQQHSSVLNLGDGFVTVDEALAQFTPQEDTPQDISAEEKAIEDGYRHAHIDMDRETIRLSDENGDGKLSQEEFVSYRHKVYPELHKKMIPMWAKLEARQAMHMYDKNSDGVLDADEVHVAHEQLWHQTHPDLYGHSGYGKEEL